MLFDVPQGSLLGPLLLKPFICDLFLIIKDIDIASYADDNIPYCSYDKFDDVCCCTFRKTASDLFQRLYINNGIKANTG